MPLSKKRKVTAVVDQHEGTSIKEARLVVDAAVSDDTIASDPSQQRIGVELGNISNVADAAVQNEERQARFKALQARAVCYITRLFSHTVMDPRDGNLC